MGLVGTAGRCIKVTLQAPAILFYTDVIFVWVDFFDRWIWNFKITLAKDITNAAFHKILV
jgi:hypothetical protein